MLEKQTPETENILIRLKRETETAHRETERLMPFDEARFSAADYLQLLVKFYSFYRVFEPQIESAIETFMIAFDYRKRLKTPKLQKDLQSLGMDEQSIAAISDNKNTPALDSAEKVFGALYVVEGSTLGGQIIARHLKGKFGFEPERGAAFFSGYAGETGKMWNDFRASITSFSEAGANDDEIIEAAAETFKKFGGALAAR